MEVIPQVEIILHLQRLTMTAVLVAVLSEDARDQPASCSSKGAQQMLSCRIRPPRSIRK